MVEGRVTQWFKDSSLLQDRTGGARARWQTQAKTPPCKDFRAQTSNQAGRVYPAGFSKLLGWQKSLCCWIYAEQAGRALPGRALLACLPAQQMLCPVNHPDNGNSCSVPVNYFLLTSAPFHWYVWSIISTVRLSLLDYAAAVAEHAEKYWLLIEITGSPQVTEGSRTVSQCWGTFTFRNPARKPASRHTTF